ncbi:MAG TPA: radical SAM protein [Nannocystis sp.]
MSVFRAIALSHPCPRGVPSSSRAAMANLGYIQVVRHCNHFCGFCSNPTTPYVHTLESMRLLVDDLVARGYFGVILTGGEPTLHPDLPAIAAYASERGLDVRVITNGTRLADRDFARALAAAGVRRVHVSIYSVIPEVEARLRGAAGTLERAFAALDRAHEVGIDVHVN